MGGHTYIFGAFGFDNHTEKVGGEEGNQNRKNQKKKYSKNWSGGGEEEGRWTGARAFLLLCGETEEGSMWRFWLYV